MNTAGTPISPGTVRQVWVLTREHNDYDQHGEYFVAVFKEKPTREQLIAYDVYPNQVDHILDGGGRENAEHIWFNLEQRAPE